MNKVTNGTTDVEELHQQTVREDPEKTKRIASAVQFIHDPRVKHTPVTNKVRFLKSKGLSNEEVCEAFGKAGQSNLIGEIKNILNQQPSSPLIQNVSDSPLPSRYTVGESNYSLRPNSFSNQAGPLYAPQPPPFINPSQEVKEADWRDYVIAIGATLLGGFAAFKAFQIYSPYEIRRKDEKIKLRRKKEYERGGKRNGKHSSSESETEHPNLSRKTPTLPIPTSPPTNTSNTGNSQEEITKLQTELKETQEALEKEKKSKAEISVTLGKVRGQLNAQSRSNEKLESRVKALQEELDKVMSEAENKKKEGETIIDPLEENKIPLVNGGIETAPSIPFETENIVDKTNSAVPNENQLPVLRATEVVEEKC